MKTMTFNTIGEILVTKNIIADADKELYVYGLRQGCIMLLNILTTLGLGCILGVAWESMAFLCTYIPIRSFAGGFHANTPTQCYLSSVLLMIGVLLVIKYLTWTPVICYLGLMIGGVLVFLMAPIEDKNKPFTAKEKVVFRKKTRILLVAEIFLVILFVQINILTVSACIIMSLNTLAFMLILGKIKNSMVEKGKYKAV